MQLKLLLANVKFGSIFLFYYWGEGRISIWCAIFFSLLVKLTMFVHKLFMQGMMFCFVFPPQIYFLSFSLILTEIRHPMLHFTQSSFSRRCLPCLYGTIIFFILLRLLWAMWYASYLFLWSDILNGFWNTYCWESVLVSSLWYAHYEFLYISCLFPACCFVASWLICYCTCLCNSLAIGFPSYEFFELHLFQDIFFSYFLSINAKTFLK